MEFLVSDYGADYGTGKSEAVRRANTIALRDAIQAANAVSADVEVVIDSEAGLEIWLDEDDDEFVPDVGGTVATIALIKHSANFTFTLKGLSLASKIQMFPDAPTFVYAMLYLDAYTRSCQFYARDLTIQGPLSFGAEDPTTDPARHGFKHQGSISPGLYGPSVIDFTNVDILGEFTTGFTSGSGDSAVTLTNCNFEAVMVGSSNFNPGLCTKSLMMLGGSYRSLYDATNEGVATYTHPNVTIYANNVDFYCPTRYGAYINGNPSTPVPTEAVFDNCRFHSVDGGGDGIQSSAACKTIARYCTFNLLHDDAAIMVALGPAELYECTFNGGTISATTGQFGSGATAYIHVHNNDYNGHTNAPDSATSFVSCVNGLVEDNDVVGAATSFAMTAGATTLGAYTLTVRGNRLSGTYGRGACATGDDHAAIEVIGNTLTGAGPLIYGIGGAGGVGHSLLVKDNVVPVDNGRILLLDYEAGVVSGTGNTLRTSPSPIDFLSGVPARQYIVNSAGVATLAGPVLALSCNTDKVTVTGGQLTSMLISGDADQNNSFAGRYTLVFPTSTAISDAGNINALTAQRNAGTEAVFVWNYATQLWDEEEVLPPHYDNPKGIAPYGQDWLPFPMNKLARQIRRRR